MFKNSTRQGKIMLMAVLVMVTVLVVIRVGATPLFFGDAAAFSGNVTLIICLAVGLAIMAAVSLFTHVRSGNDPSILPVAITAGLLGVALIADNGFSSVMWLGFGHVPAPSSSLSGLPETLMLAGQLLCGIGAGIYLIRIALIWIAEGRFCGSLFRWGALLPTAWMWLRIARYAMARAALANVPLSVYDFALFTIGMLFLLRFAGVAAQIGKVKLSAFRFLATATAVCGLADTLTRLGIYFTNDSILYEEMCLVDGTDFFLGLFALGVAFYLWNGGWVGRSHHHHHHRSGHYHHHGEDVALILESGLIRFTAEPVPEKPIEAALPVEPEPIETEAEAEPTTPEPESAEETGSANEVDLSLDNILSDILTARQEDAATE